MSDADVVTFWNEQLRATQGLRNSHDYVATEIPVGKPHVEYFEPGDQWVARGHMLRCQIVTDAAIPLELDEPVVAIDGRDFSVVEFIKLLGGYGGWGMRHRLRTRGRAAHATQDPHTEPVRALRIPSQPRSRSTRSRANSWQQRPMMRQALQGFQLLACRRDRD